MATENEMQEFFDKVGKQVAPVVKPVGDVIATAYRAASRDGTIDAFLRQGANELGAALKAFPESLQVDEAGAVFSPLYSDIAADKREAMFSPADLVSRERPASQQGVKSPEISPADLKESPASQQQQPPVQQDVSPADLKERPQSEQQQQSQQQVQTQRLSM
jgi:hypothetical protein